MSQDYSSIRIQAPKVRHITHITAGNPDWVPTEGELNKLRDDFQKAEISSGIFTTRSGVRVHNVEVVVPDDLELAESEVLAAALEYVSNETPSTLRTLHEAALELKQLRTEQSVAE